MSSLIMNNKINSNIYFSLTGILRNLSINKATRSPEISRQQVQKLTPQFVFFIYIGYRFPMSLSTIVFLKKNCVTYSQNYFFLEMLEIYSIKCKKNITPPPPQTTPTFDMFEIKNQNKGIEDYIGYRFHCSYLRFGETTSHLTSK